MKKVILTIGIPGCGKSTFVKKECKDYVQLERDILRKHICQGKEHFKNYNSETDNFWDYYYSQDKISINKIEMMINRQYDEVIKQGHELLVISDTNINKKNREHLAETLKSNGYEVEYKVFDVPLWWCLHNNQKRLDKVKESIIHDMFYRLHKDFLNEQIKI